MEIKEALILESTDPLSKAAAYLEDNVAVIITRDGKYYGMIDHQSLSSGKKPAEMKCESVVSKPPVIRGSASVMERIDSFLSGHFKALPVIDEEDKPLGITTRVELLEDLMKENLVPKSGVTELMNAPVYTIGEQENVGKAKSMMKELGARRLVVIGGGYPLGVVSAFDIAAWESKAKVSSGKRDAGIVATRNIESMRISQLVRPDITTIGQSGTLEEAAKKMVKNCVSHVIVFDQKEPVGVLSAIDLFKNLQNIYRESVDVTVSGLGEDNIGEYRNIRDKIVHILEKFSKSFDIRNATIHVKEEKSNFTLNLYVETDEGRIALKEERTTIKEALDRMADELDAILTKKKEMRRIKPRVTRHG